MDKHPYSPKLWHSFVFTRLCFLSLSSLSFLSAFSPFLGTSVSFYTPTSFPKPKSSAIYHPLTSKTSCWFLQIIRNIIKTSKRSSHRKTRSLIHMWMQNTDLMNNIIFLTNTLNLFRIKYIGNPYGSVITIWFFMTIELG